MKRVLSMVLCAACLLLCACAFAEETPGDGFLLKVWDESGLEISYLKFEIYAGGQLRSLVMSCPNEGEDFYRCEYAPLDPEEQKDLRIVCSYGVSELPPDEAILAAYSGKSVEEYPLLTLENGGFEAGQVYELRLVPGEDGSWRLEPAENG